MVSWTAVNSEQLEQHADCTALNQEGDGDESVHWLARKRDLHFCLQATPCPRCGVRLLRKLTQWPDEHLPREVTVAPHTLLVGGGFVVPLFRLAVLCVRHRSGMGVPNGPANFLLSEVVIKAGWGVGAAPG